ncbi:capsular polysaccharide synthesis protein [Amnibacterium endophyticum]|uniref:Capsular polysaccharide synthesis protein n=1 Tax=Amnibacterium endophyticum TaxID=2109337 RepID=A0ABW4LEL6_9MICO
MSPVALAGRVRRRLARIGQPPPPPPPSPKQLGIAAYRERRWKAAARQLAKALRRGGDRETWLTAASAHERLKQPALRDALALAGDHLFPSTAYDSAAAFAVATTRPRERDQVGEFLAEHADELRAVAEQRLDDVAPRYAFVYWDTPERPDVVEHCVDAMRRHLPPGLELVELSAAALPDWVEIDTRITAAVDIPAHGADMIRLHLLSRYGGLWIDSSCLLNAGFAEWSEPVRAEDLFLFTYAGSRTGNWFIWATAASYRLQLLRAAMDAWFLSGRGWTNYFQFHDVVEMLYWTDPRYRAEWDAGLHLHPREMFELHRALGRALSDEEWAAVRHAHPVNKLSWRKYNAPELRDDPATGIARLVAEPLGDVPARP